MLVILKSYIQRTITENKQNITALTMLLQKKKKKRKGEWQEKLNLKLKEAKYPLTRRFTNHASFSCINQTIIYINKRLEWDDGEGDQVHGRPDKIKMKVRT